MKNKITITNTGLNFDRADIKYVARIANFDKKYIFAREFINGFNLTLGGYKAIIELCNKNGNKEVYLIDTKEKTVTLTTMENLKKIKNKDMDFFHEYFM